MAGLYGSGLYRRTRALWRTFAAPWFEGGWVFFSERWWSWTRLGHRKRVLARKSLYGSVAWFWDPKSACRIGGGLTLHQDTRFGDTMVKLSSSVAMVVVVVRIAWIHNADPIFGTTSQLSTRNSAIRRHVGVWQTQHIGSEQKK